MSQDVGVIVPAAGRGRRMGGVKKAFLTLDGAPVLRRALEPFLDRADVVSIVVALAAEDATAPPPWLLETDDRLSVVSGGGTRAESVLAGLRALPDEARVVVVHDGARPLVSPDTVDRCIRRARDGVGAVAGCPAVDTMKDVTETRQVVGTPDRARLWHAQTPQAFPRAMLEEAYGRTDLLAQATDDASLVELAGYPVEMVESSPWNRKLTSYEDIALLEFIYRSRSM